MFIDKRHLSHGLALLCAIATVWCLIPPAFGQDLTPLTKPMLRENQVYLGLDSGIDINRNTYHKTAGWDYYPPFALPNFLIYDREISDDYEMGYSRAFVTFGIMDNLSVTARGDLSLSPGYSMDNDWYQYSLRTPAPGNSFYGVYSNDSNHTYRKNLSGGLEVNYRPVSNLQLLFMWSIEHSYFYSQDNYRHVNVSPYGAPLAAGYAVNRNEVQISEDDNLVNTIAVGATILIGGKDRPILGELDLDAYAYPFLSPLSALIHLNSGIKIVDKESTRWFPYATHNYPGLNDISPAEFRNYYDGDYTNISSTAKDRYEQFFLEGSMRAGLAESLNVEISGKADLPVRWKRNIRRIDSPYFMNFTHPTRTFWGEDDMGEAYAWSLDVTLAYRPTPYFEITLTQGYGEDFKRYEDYYWSNLQPSVTPVIGDNLTSTVDKTRTAKNITTLRLTYVTKGKEHDYSWINLDNLEKPMLGKNQFGISAFITFMDVFCSKEYEIEEGGIIQFQFDMGYHQWITGLSIDYGVLDNLMIGAYGSYGLPVSYNNNAMYRWDYSPTDYGHTRDDRIRGKRENWTIGTHIRYRPMENFEAGLGGKIDYSYEENEYYNGWVYFPGGFWPYSRNWGDSSEFYNYQVNFSLRYLF